MRTATATLDRDLATDAEGGPRPMTQHHGTQSLLRRFWAVPGTILVASMLASAQVDPVDAVRLACGPLLIGLGG